MAPNRHHRSHEIHMVSRDDHQSRGNDYRSCTTYNINAIIRRDCTVSLSLSRSCASARARVCVCVCVCVRGRVERCSCVNAVTVFCARFVDCFVFFQFLFTRRPHRTIRTELLEATYTASPSKTNSTTSIVYRVDLTRRRCARARINRSSFRHRLLLFTFSPTRLITSQDYLTKEICRHLISQSMFTF